MKVLMRFIVHKLSLLTILFLVVACHKGNISPDGLSDEVYTVRFEIKDFDQFTHPVGQKASIQRHLSNTIAGTGSGATVSAQLYDGYLYYWSFNTKSLMPDIAIHSGSIIRYNDGEIPDDFAGGWDSNGYDAGQSISIRGLQELTICFPMDGVLSVSSYGFDIGSSATGPKAFDLYYSLDGEDWEVYRSDNQFGNINTAQAKNTFTFEDVGDVFVEDLDFLWFRIVPNAGDRGNAGNYNPAAGVTRIDNIYLSGLSSSPPVTATMDRLHYYVFDVGKGDIVLSEELDFDLAAPAVSMALPQGQYQISFVRNRSNTDLLWPTVVTDRSAYWFSNSFANSQAHIFAQEQDIVVDGDVDQGVILERYYSQIKFEFTDSQDLAVVKRLRITPLHDPFFYAPYHSTKDNPVVDQSEIDVTPDFSLSKELVFNQFMGKVSTAQPMRYQVEVYDEDEVLLRSFEVSASIRHNVQLVFRGELLRNISIPTDFHIQINEDWNGSEEVDF